MLEKTRKSALINLNHRKLSKIKKSQDSMNKTWINLGTHYTFSAEETGHMNWKRQKLLHFQHVQLPESKRNGNISIFPWVCLAAIRAIHHLQIAKSLSRKRWWTENQSQAAAPFAPHPCMPKASKGEQVWGNISHQKKKGTWENHHLQKVTFNGICGVSSQKGVIRCMTRRDWNPQKWEKWSSSRNLRA